MKIYIFGAIGLVFLGILIRYFKLYWLISGYISTSKERRKEIDYQGISNELFYFLIIFAVFYLTGGILKELELYTANKISIVFFALSVLIYFYRAQKYDKRDTKKRRITVTLILGIIIFLMIYYIYFK